MKQTRLINLFAGPCAGKSGIAFELAGIMKRKHMSVELIPEVAKPYTYDRNWKALKCQPLITGKQLYEIARVFGEVDWIITDSPLPLGVIYGRDGGHRLNWVDPAWESWCMNTFRDFKSVNVWVERDPNAKYDTTGRRQTLEESLVIDKQIKTLLYGYNIPIHVHENADQQTAFRLSEFIEKQ